MRRASQDLGLSVTRSSRVSSASLTELQSKSPRTITPLPMVLHCPHCRVDEGDAGQERHFSVIDARPSSPQTFAVKLHDPRGCILVNAWLRFIGGAIVSATLRQDEINTTQQPLYASGANLTNDSDRLLSVAPSQAGSICGRPPTRKAWQRGWVWSVAVICPAFTCGSVGPLAEMGCADRIPNRAVMSKHRWTPRVVPILGLTDRHLAAVLASARAARAVSGLCRFGRAVEFAADQHGPDDAGHLVGERHRRELLRLARQQIDKPGRGAAGCGLADDGGGAEHQQPAQAFVPLPADLAEPLSPRGRMVARGDASHAAKWRPERNTVASGTPAFSLTRSSNIATFSGPFAPITPNSAAWPRTALISMVRCLTNKSRPRSSISAAWSSVLLIGTKRIPGRLIASQIASAHGSSRGPARGQALRASFLPRLT
jgi:hypothetical protein